MLKVLRANGGRGMTSRELADAINARGLYERGDSKPLQATQVRARANKYPGDFTLDDERVYAA